MHAYSPHTCSHVDFQVNLQITRTLTLSDKLTSSTSSTTIGLLYAQVERTDNHEFEDSLLLIRVNSYTGSIEDTLKT